MAAEVFRNFVRLLDVHYDGAKWRDLFEARGDVHRFRVLFDRIYPSDGCKMIQADVMREILMSPGVLDPDQSTHRYRHVARDVDVTRAKYS